MLILGIAGGTGSGKTTVVNQILNELPTAEVTVISQDSYYKKNFILLNVFKRHPLPVFR